MIPYLDRDFIRTFMLAFAALLALVQIGYLVAVLLEMSGYIFAGGQSKLGWVFLYYICTIPRQTAFTIPLATAVSVLWVFTTKARKNEILAWLAGGVSPMRLARPLLVLSAVFSVACFLTMELLANTGDRMARRIEYINIRGKSLETITSDKNIFQKGVGNRFYSISELDLKRELMRGVYIMEMAEDWKHPKWSLMADEGVRAPAGSGSQWLFRDAVLRTFDESGQLVKFREANEMMDKELPGLLEDELTKYLKQQYRPAQMGTLELLDTIDIYRAQNKPVHELQTYLNFNIVLPLASLVLAMLMCGHILRPGAIGYMAGYGGGLALIAAYFLVLLVCREGAKNGVIHAVPALWIPSAAFVAFAFYLMGKHRTAS